MLKYTYIPEVLKKILNKIIKILNKKYYFKYHINKLFNFI